ncbi:BTAD domain-containing putative transcriptional regulator [Spirillospora sp. CA-255316]
MRFGVLGAVAVWAGDEEPVRVPEAKVRALLAHLLAHAGRPVAADRLIADLWGERLPANPSAVLQTKVSQLRRVLEDAEPGGRGLVVSDPPGYGYRLEGAAVDAEEFAALVERARGRGSARERAGLLAEALGLWRGAAFADFGDEEFARSAIMRLEERRLEALEALAEARLELGEHAALVSELAELVERHPLRERLRAAHMRALYRSGRQSEALESYEALRVHLAEELGLDPGPELVALQEAILKQDPGLAPAPSGNLPSPVNELIGRDGAVARVRALLGGSRLVTLTGPGGVGKTRLAVEAAGGPVGDLPDGVRIVDLAALARDTPSAETRICDLVAVALELREEAGTRTAWDPLERLAEALRQKRLLLVLDNCEHLVVPLAGVVARLLRDAPGLRVLATSQEPLGVAGEVLQNVPPLDAPGPSAEPDPETLLQFGAVRLFVARAAAAAPGFALDAGNAAAVAAICRRLDGIPLALELAATRVRVLGARELAARLDDRFRLLASGRRDAPDRQRTLRAVIDWSWELLTEAERIVLRRLAVQVGGCALEAAEAVCAGDGVRGDEVLDLLGRLVDRSLVVAAEGPDGPRYRLLESVAAYCAERMREVAGEFDAVRHRHARYYADLAERARLHGRDQLRWLARLDTEAANLNAAFDFGLGSGGEETLRLAGSLAWYWVLRGRLGEAMCALTAVLEGPGEAGALRTVRTWRAALENLSGCAGDPVRELPPEEAPDPRAEWFLAFTEIDFGVLAVSAARTRRVLDRFRAAGDRWGVAAARLALAKQALARSDLAGVRSLGGEASEAFTELGDRWGLMQATSVLAGHAEIVGDYAEARRLHRDGLRLAEELGLWTDASFRWAALGRIALLEGDLAAAEDLHQRAARLAAEQRNQLAEEYADTGLGLVARRRGRLDEAESYLRRWLDWNREAAPNHGTALILAELGFIAELRGDAERALALHQDGLEAARATGDPRAVALAWEGMAGACALAGDRDRAERLLADAAAARERAGAPLPPAERGDVERIEAAVKALD